MCSARRSPRALIFNIGNSWMRRLASARETGDNAANVAALLDAVQ
jgi:hypothetical protein